MPVFPDDYDRRFDIFSREAMFRAIMHYPKNKDSNKQRAARGVVLNPATRIRSQTVHHDGPLLQL